MSHLFTVNCIQTMHRSLRSFSLFPLAGWLCVRSVVGGELEENIFQAQTNSAQFEKPPAVFDNFRRNLTADIIALRRLYDNHEALSGAFGINFHAACSRDLRQHLTETSFRRLHLDFDLLPAL